MLRTGKVDDIWYRAHRAWVCLWFIAGARSLQTLNLMIVWHMINLFTRVLTDAVCQVGPTEREAESERQVNALSILATTNGPREFY